MKIFIFEGIDGAGKTSAIKELRKNMKGEHPLFIDRFIHSNYVYEKLKGNDTVNDLKLICEDLIRDFEIQVIYIDVSPSRAISRLSKDFGHGGYTKEILATHSVLFEESFKILNMPLIRINGDLSLNEMVQEIMRIICE